MCVLPARGLAGWHRCWDRRDCVLATPRLAPCQPVQLGSRGCGGPVPSQSAGSPVAPPSGLWGLPLVGPGQPHIFWAENSCLDFGGGGGQTPPELSPPADGQINWWRAERNLFISLLRDLWEELTRVPGTPVRRVSASQMERSPSFPLSATGLLSHEECVVATTPVPKAKGDSPPLVQACFDPSSFRNPGPVGAPGRWSAL